MHSVSLCVSTDVEIVGTMHLQDSACIFEWIST